MLSEVSSLVQLAQHRKLSVTTQISLLFPHLPADQPPLEINFGCVASESIRSRMTRFPISRGRKNPITFSIAPPRRHGAASLSYFLVTGFWFHWKVFQLDKKLEERNRNQIRSLRGEGEGGVNFFQPPPSSVQCVLSVSLACNRSRDITLTLKMTLEIWTKISRADELSWHWVTFAFFSSTSSRARRK